MFNILLAHPWLGIVGVDFQKAQNVLRSTKLYWNFQRWGGGGTELKLSNLLVEGYGYFVEQGDFLHTTQVCNICIAFTW